MGTMTVPAEGGCRCGRLRFRLSAAPLLTSVCHCRGCQRMSASAFSTTVAIATDAFTVIAGEPVIGGVHGAETRHHHCDWCKSWVFTRVEPDIGFVNVRATVLDDAGWFVPFIEVHTDEKLAWAVTPARHRYATVPAIEDYQALVAEYQAASG